MTVAAITMVKDEADVIAGTLRHLADEAVDVIIVADNNSTDGTRDILDALDLPCELVVIDDPDPAYEQSRKMTALAHEAARMGAEWIVPFDADEVWVCHDGRLADTLRTADGNVATANLINHFASAVDVDDIDPFVSMVWRQPLAQKLPKVAYRYHPEAIIEQGNHGVTHPDASPSFTRLEIRHFPYRSPEQMVRKAINGARAYEASNLPKNMGAHWRSYGDLIDRHGEEALHAVFREHFWYLSPVDAGLIHDPAPYMRWSL